MLRWQGGKRKEPRAPLHTGRYSPEYQSVYNYENSTGPGDSRKISTQLPVLPGRYPNPDAVTHGAAAAAAGAAAGGGARHVRHILPASLCRAAHDARTREISPSPELDAPENGPAQLGFQAADADTTRFSK